MVIYTYMIISPANLSCLHLSLWFPVLRGEMDCLCTKAAVWVVGAVQAVICLLPLPPILFHWGTTCCGNSMEATEKCPHWAILTEPTKTLRTEKSEKLFKRANQIISFCYLCNYQLFKLTMYRHLDTHNDRCMQNIFWWTLNYLI